MDGPPGAARSEDPDAACTRSPVTGYECRVVVSAAPVVVLTPRRSVRAGVGAGVGVGRVADVFTTGGCSGAEICFTFAFA